MTTTPNNDWSLRSVRETSPGEFKAFVRSPQGKAYTVGTFPSAEEAERAINELLASRWHG